MVTKEFCQDVPRNEDVEGEVETCVNTPKEVCHCNTCNTYLHCVLQGVSGWEADSSEGGL